MTDEELISTLRLELDATRAELAASRDEVSRLVLRREELLALVVKVSQETPFSDEAKDALSQRGKLLAEIGTLRAENIRVRNTLGHEASELRVELARVEFERDRALGRRL